MEVKAKNVEVVYHPTQTTALTVQKSQGELEMPQVDREDLIALGIGGTLLFMAAILFIILRNKGSARFLGENRSATSTPIAAAPKKMTHRGTISFYHQWKGWGYFLIKNEAGTIMVRIPTFMVTNIEMDSMVQVETESHHSSDPMASSFYPGSKITKLQIPSVKSV